jgi:hypothetical protein
MRPSVIEPFVVLALVIGPLGILTATGDDMNPDSTALLKAVRDGKDIRMALDLSACTVQGTVKPGPSVSGSLHFDAYMVQADQTIAFATTHFTLRPDKTPVDEFLTFRVHPNGDVEARTSFLNPITFVVSQESAFDCRIGRGATFHW